MNEITALPLKDATLSAVQAEMLSAVAKHGHDMTVLNPTMLDTTKLVVLVEEVGEVARAMTYDNGDRLQLVRELLQVAAVAAGWAQALDDTQVQELHLTAELGEAYAENERLRRAAGDLTDRYERNWKGRLGAIGDQMFGDLRDALDAAQAETAADEDRMGD